ncbi:MAG: hypothetical protein M1834_009078 [Cirrosporium novae-zelandiae]|nr:MAG: hypothetical protein M1834_009078 [Cirrosporium novae-zelandiae]
MEEDKAAGTIQRTYRGHRDRRRLQGMGLDPSTRWLEAVKDARYRNITKPSAPHLSSSTPANGRDSSDATRHSSTQQNWRRVGDIARHAGQDELDSSSDECPTMDNASREEHRQRKGEKRRERMKTAKMMDLQYFLEMVDHKHRHGSNLRAYHEEWKKSNTRSNFFYWLDSGSGNNLEVPGVSREKLEREQVRYMSKEERMNYLVQVDEEGRLCWAKNNQRINTSTQYKDSMYGIVPEEEHAPTWTANGTEMSSERKHSSTSTSSISSNSPSSSLDSERNAYSNEEFKNATGPKKLKYISPPIVLNHLLRKSVKKNTWIFVADVSFRLYVGIKQSGSFQHSSFLQGSRIAAAGLIKVKNGQLRSLSPLSGHYRPPTSSFKAFVDSLKERKVDMSHVSISKSYAVLIGLEAYVKIRRRFKKVGKKVKDTVTKPGETVRNGDGEKADNRMKEGLLVSRERKAEDGGGEKESNEKLTDVNGLAENNGLN